jgi:hypothetical protein
MGRNKNIRSKAPLEQLLARYEDLEKHFYTRDDSCEYRTLVTATTNQKYPVQRWFHQKESFSVDLMAKLLSDWNIKANS